MTEEENKAIKIVKEIWQFTDYSTDKIALKVVLDLIEKLQKENEELRVQGSIVYLDYKILKDKIRELFKELYIIEESKYAKIKTIDSDKAFKFVEDIEELLKED